MPDSCLKVWCVKLPWAFVSAFGGLVIGLPPAAVFTVAAVAITVVRLPINFYVTLKVALTSLILKPGLRYG